MPKLDITNYNPLTFDGVRRVKKSNCMLTANDLADEESEVYILQCPSGVDLPQLLEGSKIRLDGKTQFEVDTFNYEAIGIPTTDSKPQESLITLIPKDDEDGAMKLVAAPINGYIVVRESVEAKPLPILSPKSKPLHIIPKDVKIRHPIYGINMLKKSKRKKTSVSVVESESDVTERPNKKRKTR